jgi:hypothetical protein
LYVWLGFQMRSWHPRAVVSLDKSWTTGFLWTVGWIAYQAYCGRSATEMSRPKKITLTRTTQTRSFHQHQMDTPEPSLIEESSPSQLNGVTDE